MAKNTKGSEPRAKKATEAEALAPVKKVKGPKTAEELANEDLIQAAKEFKKEEEVITSEAIPAAQLKKELYAKQVAGQFDWDAYETKGFGEGYSKDKKQEMLNLYGNTVTTVNSGELVEGIVVGINDRDVILNIGFKSDGLVPLAEFKDNP
ncbi:MAG: hypothetical protein ACK48F_12935, partial [Chryseotalea sp.]